MQTNDVCFYCSPITWVNLPDQLTGCTPTTFSWSGGAAPYTLRIYPLNSGGLYEEHTVSSTSYNWQVDMPFGSTVYAWVVGANYMTAGSAPSFSPTYYVFNGTNDGCVNPLYVNASVSEPPPKPVVVINTRTSSVASDPTDTALFTGNRQGVDPNLSSGAIAGIVVGASLIVLIYLLYLFIKRRSRRHQQQQQQLGSIEYDEGKPSSGAAAASTTATNVHPSTTIGSGGVGGGGTYQMTTLDKLGATSPMTMPYGSHDDASSSKSVLSPPPPIGARYAGGGGGGGGGGHTMVNMSNNGKGRA
ncbi:hypothetical protein ACM66B_004706 [Microbotryomycetes sp. NB124-2]